MKPVKLFDQFVNEGLHSKLKKARKEMEKAFKNKGVTIDVQDLGTDSGFFITYDNISKEELLKIAQSVDNKWKYHVSNPIKSQETGHYLIVDLTRDVEAIDEASYEDPIKKKAEKRYKDHGGSVRISGIGKPFEQIKVIPKGEYTIVESNVDGRASWPQFNVTLLKPMKPFDLAVQLAQETGWISPWNYLEMRKDHSRELKTTYYFPLQPTLFDER